jgi:HD-GYP domain-containing protein (c-di-GMP phosphodiesterase class II)
MSAAIEIPAGLAPGRTGADLDPDVDRIFEDARNLCARPVRMRDRLPGFVSGGSFLAVALTIAALVPSSRTPSLAAYIFFIVAYAVSSRIEFEVGPCLALPTELVLVPMLFVLPLPAVPLCVAAGLLLGDVAAARGRIKPERVPLRLANSWHAVGPVLVLAAAGSPQPTLREFPVLVAALAAQFAFDFTSTAALEWFRVGVTPKGLARFAAWAYVVDASLAPVGIAFALIAVSKPATILLALPLFGMLAFFARERRTRIDHALELGNAYRGTALLLGDVVEADDAYTGGHSRDVVALVLAVSDKLGLDSRSRRDAEFAALLHDVGKVRVPAEIINKIGPLDDVERAVMNRHTLEGERMLDKVGGLLGDVGRIVRSSHEHWDGTGYPDGLKGASIPLGARIVSVCDAFSAMTTDRSYRDALSYEAALAELRACSGSQFDARVVEALCDVAAAVPRAL